MSTKTRKVIFICVIMFACIVLFKGTAYAGNCTISVSPKTVKPGESFTVTINPGGTQGFSGTIKIKKEENVVDSASVAYLKGAEALGQENKTSATFKLTADGNYSIEAALSEMLPGEENEHAYTYSENVTVKTPEPPPQNTNTQPANTNTEPKPQNTNTQPKPENTNTNPPVNNTAPKNNTVVNNTVEPTVVNPEFKAVNEKVYAVNSCNVRSSCSTATNNNKIGSLEKDELVIRTGVSSEWSRIVFNGKVAYVASKLLTTTPPDDEENTVEENTVENEISNELDTIKSEVGVLPEVGNNVSVQLFFVTTMISISIISSFIYLKIKEK